MEGPSANFGFKATYQGPEGVEGLKVLTNTSVTDTTLLTKEQSDAVPVDVTTVPTNKLRDNSITSTQIANAAITTAKIHDAAITTTKLANGTIETAKIANAAITLDKIQDGAITAAKIGPGAVTTAKLGTGAITTAKIADGAVNWPNTRKSAFTSSKFADGSVTTAKIAGSVVFGSSYFGTNSVNGASIPANNVTNAKIIAPSALDDTKVDHINVKNTAPFTNTTVADTFLLSATQDLSDTVVFSNSVSTGTPAYKRLIMESSSTADADNNFIYDRNAGVDIVRIATTGTSGSTLYLQKSNGGTVNIFDCIKDGALVSEVRSTGACYNATGTYGTISDQRIKTDITPATSQIDDVKKVQFVKYRLKRNMQQVKEAIQAGLDPPEDDDPADDDSPHLLGVLAQQLEDAGMSQLVYQTEDGIKHVKTSVLQLKCFKALQELITRVDNLERNWNGIY